MVFVRLSKKPDRAFLACFFCHGSNKFQSDTFGDDLFLVCLLKQPAHRLLPLAAVVERQVVHVHPDKPVYTLRVEASRKLNRVGGSLLAMIQTVLDAVADILRDPLHNFSPEIALDDVAAERQRQFGLFEPPLSEIDNLMKT